MKSLEIRRHRNVRIRIWMVQSGLAALTLVSFLTPSAEAQEMPKSWKPRPWSVLGGSWTRPRTTGSLSEERSVPMCRPDSPLNPSFFTCARTIASRIFLFKPTWFGILQATIGPAVPYRRDRSTAPPRKVSRCKEPELFFQQPDRWWRSGAPYSVKRSILYEPGISSGDGTTVPGDHCHW